ncbi:hypothetical protein C2142_38585 [Streptomyces sp. CB01881]|nr:hypothetical protein C2142_38585 [Streptomyces sp. CB01881]
MKVSRRSASTWKRPVSRGGRDREDQVQGRAEPEPDPGQAGGVRHDVPGTPGPLADRGGDLVGDREAYGHGEDDEADRLIQRANVNGVAPHTPQNGDDAELDSEIEGLGH